MRVQVVGRDEHAVVPVLRGLEQPGEVLDGVVLLDAGADQSPGDALLAQDVVLRVDDDQRRVGLVELHRDVLATVVMGLALQAFDFRFQFGDPGLEFLDHRGDLPLGEPLVDVLLAVHVPGLDREQDRPLDLARVRRVAEPFSSAASPSTTRAVPQTFTRRCWRSPSGRGTPSGSRTGCPA